MFHLREASRRHTERVHAKANQDTRAVRLSRELAANAHAATPCMGARHHALDHPENPDIDRE